MKIVNLSAIPLILFVAGNAYAQTAPAPSTTTTNATQTAAPRFSSATLIRDLLANPEAKAVLVKHIPDVVAHPSLEEQALDMSLAAIAEYIGGDTMVNAIAADLALIK
jgi:para-nitrobenzyl esterase